MEDATGIEEKCEWMMKSIAKNCAGTSIVVYFKFYGVVRWRGGGVRGLVCFMYLRYFECVEKESAKLKKAEHIEL